MNDKKHIDRLFQERFKDFEATPSDAVWENIEAQLNKKKKKRRVIPIWWRYAGVAALLLLLFTIGSIYFNGQEETPINNVVDTKDVLKQESEVNKTEDVITNTDSEDILKEKSQIEQATDKINSSNEASIAESTSSEKESLKVDSENLNLNKKQIISNKAIKLENKGAVASNNSKEDSNLIKTDIASNTNSSNEAVKNEDALINTEKARDLINNPSKNNTAVAEVDNKTSSDSEKEENTKSIEDAINENKKIIEEEKKLNRWSIAPNAAPVYFSSLGEGSSIDPQFNGNSKSTDPNMSYGIKASYAINKKLSIRSGVNKVNLGYNTNNVVVFQSVGFSSSAVALENINSNGINADNISLISGENLASSKAPESFKKSSNTSLNQSLGYIEVPLEIQYALTNKKLGVNVIGGFSSFFLSNNEIFSESEGSKSFIGKASNINNVSYSANFGLGLNYQFSKKIDLNLEPMFKYQINTFNNTSGDFKPYFIGIYTGFAIKF